MKQTFRFKTRLQRLNSIEASSRAKLNFLEALYRFHQQQGNPRVSLPTINNKPLDLWLLRKHVHNLGGYDEVGVDTLRNQHATTLNFNTGNQAEEMVGYRESIRLWRCSWPLNSIEDLVYSSYSAL